MYKEEESQIYYVVDGELSILVCAAAALTDRQNERHQWERCFHKDLWLCVVELNVYRIW